MWKMRIAEFGMRIEKNVTGYWLLVAGSRIRIQGGEEKTVARSLLFVTGEGSRTEQKK
jgi:hypothetical protein